MAKKYLIKATFDENGFVTGFWVDAESYDNVPKGAVEISQKDYDVLVANQGMSKYIDGKVVMLEQQEPEPAKVTEITRRQGLIAVYRQKKITEADIRSKIETIEDADKRYEAGIEFEANTWRIDSDMVKIFAKLYHINGKELQQLFNYAATV